MADIAAGQPRSYGDGTPQSLASANEQALAEFDERRAEPLAAMIVAQADAYLKAWDQGPTEEAVVTPLGPMSPGRTGVVPADTHAWPRLRPGPRTGPSTHARPHPGRPDPAVPDHGHAAGDRHLAYGRAHRGLHDPPVEGARFGVTVTNGADPCAHATGPPGLHHPHRAGHLPPDGTRPLRPVERPRPGPYPRPGRKPWLAPRFPALFKAP